MQSNTDNSHFELPSILNKHDIDVKDERAYVTENKVRRGGHVCRSTVFLLIVCALFWSITANFPQILWINRYSSVQHGFKLLGNRVDTTSLPWTLEGAGDFDWDTHVPTKWLNWTDCYELFGLTFQCTRLSVPLDYSDPEGEQAAIALIRHRSSYPPDHEKYKGPILFNPGGPGGSGVLSVLGATQSFRKIIGDEFDFVGFDPRGVLFTTPQFNVFKTTLETAKFYVEMPKNLNASSTSFSEVFVKSKVFGMLAEIRAEKSASYLSTGTVATDMMSILNATGHDKLQYWGFSYGTVLGATFAALFPNNVGRVVIDGVVDSEDYYTGQWSNNLRDSDAALFDIYNQCVEAGPEHCPLYDDSAELIANRVNRLLNKIKTEPIPYYNPGGPFGDSYGTIDYATVKGMIFNTLYSTHWSGRGLLSVLSTLEKRGLLSVYSPTDALFQCNCPESEKARHPWQYMASTIGIACGDAAPIEETLEEAVAHYEKIAHNSTFSDTWPIHLFCSGWPIRAKDRYKGTFERNTSYPLLLIGNTADPVTPLWNAHKMSKGFTDSVVLTQNSSGHCSISASSLCTLKAVRNYFQDGSLPERGTVCETESSIFGNAMESLGSLNSEDLALLRAAEELRELKIVPPLFGQGLPSPDLLNLVFQR